MELRDALLQISEIRSTMARTHLFRGYRAATTAFSGFVAILVAGLQAALVPNPDQHHGLYLALWLSAAALCLIVVGMEMILRSRRSSSKLQRELTMLAVEQFVPALVAGGLLSYVIYDFLPHAFTLLPGLWLLLFSLGIFASCRLLPRPTFYVAAYYLIAAIVVFILARGDQALSPVAMGFPFGVGQLLTAAMLYHTLERRHENAKIQ